MVIAVDNVCAVVLVCVVVSSLLQRLPTLQLRVGCYVSVCESWGRIDAGC